MKTVVDLIVLGVIVLSLDSVYLSIVGTTYAEQIAHIQRVAMRVNLLGAIACYALIVSGIYYFLVREKRSVMDAFLLGIFVYGVFDTTNLAIFKNWRIDLAVVDTLWGGILFALTTYIMNRLSYWLM